ncbi:B12-binding domain-containing radical SAM protein [bacterium]|nr:B12-binding domain-containing radical SAM protein [bacterium]
MRLLLLFPSSEQGVQSLFVQTKGGGIGNKPPLGLLYIASYVLENSSHEVLVHDLMAQPLDDDKLIDKIRAFSPDVVGITCWTDFWYPVYRLIKIIKENFPQVHITLGGPHVGIYPRETLENEYVDSIVLGDGEKPMLNLLNNLEHGEKLLDEGIYLKRNAPPQKFSYYIEKDIDSLPFPARTLLPLDDYTSVLAKESMITTMITSRGCPYRCVYCKLNFQKTLSRSAESVVNEMALIENMGIRELEIYDDTFTWSQKRLVDICRGIIEKGIKLNWAIRDRVSNIDEETLHLMKQAGCVRIHLGIETGNPQVLEKIKKNISLEQAGKSVALAKKTGFKVLTYFMIGLPDETEKEVMETIDFAVALDSDYAEFNVCIPYPGTEMYNEGLSGGIIPEDFWREYALHPVPDFVMPYLYEQHLRKEEMVRLSHYATRKFYLRPKVIIREIVKCSSFGEFRKKTRMGLNLIKNVLGGKIHNSGKP